MAGSTGRQVARDWHHTFYDAYIDCKYQLSPYALKCILGTFGHPLSSTQTVTPAVSTLPLLQDPSVKPASDEGDTKP